jgi:hypothetical protein
MFGLERDTLALFELTVQAGNPIGQNILALGEDESGELYVLTPTSLLAIEAVVSPWQNPANRLDTDGDGLISPVGDVLPLINELNRRRLIDSSGRLPNPPLPPLVPPPFYDVNGDGFLSPTGDVLPVVNFLNEIGLEGELSFAPGGEDADVAALLGRDILEELNRRHER